MSAGALASAMMGEARCGALGAPRIKVLCPIARRRSNATAWPLADSVLITPSGLVSAVIANKIPAMGVWY